MPKPAEVDRNELIQALRDTQAAVLELQRFLQAPDAQFVRSCTSCLADSCNKPPSFAAG